MIRRRHLQAITPFAATVLGLGLLFTCPAFAESPVPEPSSESSAAASKAGPTETERKQIFRELHAAEKRATREAGERFKDDPQGMRRVEYEGELERRYRAEVAKKHGVSEKQLVLIGAEGFEKGWPLIH